MGSERDFEYCMVGNIIDKHYYGEQKLEIRRGTKQFRPNAKVYIFPEFPGMGHENIVVIGKPRKLHKMIEIAIKTNRIKNVRLEKIYSPWLKEKIQNNFFYESRKRDGEEEELISLNGL
ncbi:hypothetical protein MASR1M29_05280 [Cloacibacterium normanense]